MGSGWVGTLSLSLSDMVRDICGLNNEEWSELVALVWGRGKKCDILMRLSMGNVFLVRKRVNAGRKVGIIEIR